MLPLLTKSYHVWRVSLILVGALPVILVFLILSAGTLPTEAQQIVVSVDFGPFVQDTSLRKAIYEMMRNKSPNLLTGAEFAVTSERIQGEWELVSIASLDGIDCSREYVGSGNCGRLVIAFQDKQIGWRVALEGTQLFSSILAIAPSSFVDSQAKQHLDPLKRKVPKGVTSFLAYKFPWVYGQWDYWLGWRHDDTPDALDIGTTGDDNDKRVLAAADGSISFICRGRLTANVRISHSDGLLLSFRLKIWTKTRFG